MNEKDAQQIMDLVKEAPSDTTLDDLLQALLNEFGGPVGYARYVRSVFDEATAGSSTQQKCLDFISTLISRKAALEKHVQADFSEMSQEDLEAFFYSQVVDSGNAPAPTENS